jgi:hypothetical protein
MTVSDTPTKLLAPRDLDEYSSFVGRLLANQTHPEVVPAGLLLLILEKSLKHRVLLDQAKKGLFYGKPGDLLADQLEHLPPSYRQIEYRSELTPLLHALLGLRTEADELLLLLVELMRTGCADDGLIENRHVVNTVVDEGGDALFYLQAALNAVRSSVMEAIQANGSKLLVRFPTGYNEAAARNPDKAAELEAQQASAKVYSDPNCIYVYCPDPEGCKANGCPNN